MKSLAKVTIVTVLIFGGIFAAIIGIEDWIIKYPIVRYLSIGLSLLFFALLGFAYKEIRRYRDEIHKRDAEFSKATHILAEDLGFLSKVLSEDMIEMDGSKVSKREIEIEVLKGELSSKEHRTWIWSDAAIKGYQVRVFGDADESKITWKTVQASSQSFTTIVEFSPPLKIGNKAKYTILENFGPGTYAMTQEEVLEYVKLNKWITDEPYLVRLFLITFPAQELISRVVLPKEFPISGREYWDVKIGEGDSRAYNEYERLKSEGCFTTDMIGNSRLLQLRVKNPKMGLSYWIKWKPPFRKDYDRILANYKKV